MNLQFGQHKKQDRELPKTPVPSAPPPWMVPLIDRHERRQDNRIQPEIEMPQPPPDWAPSERKSPEAERGVCIIYERKAPKNEDSTCIIQVW